MTCWDDHLVTSCGIIQLDGMGPAVGCMTIGLEDLEDLYDSGFTQLHSYNMLVV